MASAFGHACLATALGVHWKSTEKTKLIILGIVSSVLPDLDILAFKFGIPYTHMFGHRGISHSIVFAILWSLILQKVFFRTMNKQYIAGFYLFVCTLSHGILDAMTTGGRGIAFFAPFSDDRIFLPWRMITVSPLSASDFFGEWGLRVIKSELLWIGLPSLIIVLFPFVWSYLRKLISY